MDLIHTLSVIILYFAAAALLARRLSHGAAAPQESKALPLGLGLLGALAHTLLLYGGIFTPAGMNLAFFTVLSLVGWLITDC